jgi:hypothetical protein
MAARLICTKSKQGQSLSQISELTGLTIDQVKEILAQATGLSPTDVSMILHMTQRGVSLEQIHQDTGVALEVLEQFLPHVIKESVVGLETQIVALADQGKEPYEISRLLGVSERAVLAFTLDCKTYSPPSTTEETKQQPTTPHQTFLYYCYDNQLLRVSLLTGEASSHKVPHYQFKMYCRWSELPGGSLLITGGTPAARDVVRVDAGTFAVSPQPPMHTARSHHATVYHSQYVYVLGETECERYSCAEIRWEVLPALPVAGVFMSGVELENSVYALGGYDGNADRALDTVQKLSLDTLTWQLMQLKLPQAAKLFPCFKTETQVYLVIEETLYSFTPLEVKAVKTLDASIECFSSYYSRGTLYYELYVGIDSLALKLG